jgi:hypothetical protein
MDSRAFWLRLKTHRWVYSFSIVATLAVGILIGSVISYGVKGKEGQKSSDATPLTVPSPKQLSGEFSQIAKQLGPCVVNINTGRAAGKVPMATTTGAATIMAAAVTAAWMTFSIASSVDKVDRAVPGATPRFASVRWVRA